MEKMTQCHGRTEMSTHRVATGNAQKWKKKDLMAVKIYWGKNNE